MDRVRTVATFVAGVLVGGSAAYFSPPGQQGAASGPPGLSPPTLPPLPGGEGLPQAGAGQAPGIVPPIGTDGQPIPLGEAPPLLSGAPAQPGPLTAAPPGATPLAPPTNLPPPDGAEGPAPGDLSTAPVGMPQTSGSRLERHLRMATVLWTSQADLAKVSGKADVRKLAVDLSVHAESVPPIGDHMPPMQDVAGYLAGSRVLLDRMTAAGMDTADLSLQIDMLMRPPRGKIPGGPKAEGAP